MAKAGEVERRVSSVPQAEAIDFDTDHFSVSLLKGFLSSRDSFLQSLLGSNSKFAVSIDAEVGFFDGDKLQNIVTHSNEDIGRNVDRPWGINPLLLDNVAADASATLTMRVAIYREDNIARILGAIDRGKDALAGGPPSCPPA